MASQRDDRQTTSNAGARLIPQDTPASGGTWRKLTFPMQFGAIGLPSAIMLFVFGAVIYPHDFGAHIFATIAGVLLEAALVVLVLERLAKRQQNREWGFVSHTVALRVAATMVDVTRLASVRWTENGYKYSAARYDEFRAVAHRHLTDLRFALLSLALGVAPAEYGEARQIELQLGALVQYLQLLPPSALKPYPKEWSTLLETVGSIERFLRYDASLSFALAAGREAAAKTTTATMSLDEFFTMRLAAQNALPPDANGEPPLIRYDITGDLAVQYFAIDSTLLPRVVP